MGRDDLVYNFTSCGRSQIRVFPSTNDVIMFLRRSFRDFRERGRTIIGKVSVNGPTIRYLKGLIGISNKSPPSFPEVGRSFNNHRGWAKRTESHDQVSEMEFSLKIQTNRDILQNNHDFVQNYYFIPEYHFLIATNFWSDRCNSLSQHSQFCEKAY